MIIINVVHICSGLFDWI